MLRAFRGTQLNNNHRHIDINVQPYFQNVFFQPGVYRDSMKHSNNKPMTPMKDICSKSVQKAAAKVYRWLAYLRCSGGRSSFLEPESPFRWLLLGINIVTHLPRMVGGKPVYILNQMIY